MIILLGPDNSGKTTLAQQLALQSIGTQRPMTSWKAVASTGYKDYMEFLRGPKCDPLKIETWKPGLALQMEGAVICDRFFYCELPYARIYRQSQQIQWSLKQWHNMHLSTIAFNPTFILATEKSSSYEDEVPEEMFDPILREYWHWLGVHGITPFTYNWREEPPDGVSWAEHFLEIDGIKSEEVEWWTKGPTSLLGVGNTLNPRVLILAQDLGPSNVHRVPFEQGPSGYYLSELLDGVGAPLESFYITNFIKTKDGEKNRELLAYELDCLRPSYAILLGQAAKGAVTTIGEYVSHSDIHETVHPGYIVNHSASKQEMETRKAKFWEKWEEVWKKILSSE